jgi:hypothetical protein
MKGLALLSALPILAFMLLYSLDVGCFFCLGGEWRGSNAERWINIGLGTTLFAAVGIALWRQIKARV